MIADMASLAGEIRKLQPHNKVQLRYQFETDRAQSKAPLLAPHALEPRSRGGSIKSGNYHAQCICMFHAGFHTTRIVMFLVGEPYKPSFATVTGTGDNPTSSKS